MLHKADAWSSLPVEVRQQLYSMLPSPCGDEPAHDIDVHPLRTPYRRHLEKEVRKWQADLADGKETNKWRNDALQAGKDRIDGKWAEVQEMQRNSYWARNAESAASPTRESPSQRHESNEEPRSSNKIVPGEEQKVNIKEA